MRVMRHRSGGNDPPMRVASFCVVLLAVVGVASASETDLAQQRRAAQDDTVRGLPARRPTFPATVMFGVGTSAWQIEGSGGDRPRSVWDEFVSTLGDREVLEAESGIEFHERYAQDAELMADAGVKDFKMSLSWPRLMRADGTAIEEGFDYYRKVFAALRMHGIEPHVTLFHWDTPTWCCKNVTTASSGVCDGAWADARIVKDFVAYADAVFSRLGDGVKYWTTISEPKTVAEMGYGAGVHAPGKMEVREQLRVGHNMLLAHARAVALFRKKYSHLSGKISINLNSAWAEPASGSSEDVRAANDAMDEELGWFADPIYTGDYPASMRARLGEFLPRFTGEESLLVKGSTDYFALNHYTSYYVKHVAEGRASGQLGMSGKPQPWDITLTSESSTAPIGKQAQSEWLHVVPWGLEKVLLRIKQRYGNPQIIITENGIDIAERPSIEESLDDSQRVKFLDAYLGATQEAMRKGANVIGYFYWSIFDNVEWVDGRAKRFGLVYVDYDGKYGDKMLRYPKKSLEHYSSYMRGDAVSVASLGAARASTVEGTIKSAISSFGTKRQGELHAVTGMALTMVSVFAAALMASRVKVTANEDEVHDEHTTLV